MLWRKSPWADCDDRQLNHRIIGLGWKGPEKSSSSKPLLWTGSSSTTAGYSKLHTTPLPEVQHPVLLTACVTTLALTAEDQSQKFSTTWVRLTWKKSLSNILHDSWFIMFLFLVLVCGRTLIITVQDKFIHALAFSFLKIHISEGERGVPDLLTYIYLIHMKTKR